MFGYNLYTNIVSCVKIKSDILQKTGNSKLFKLYSHILYMYMWYVQHTAAYIQDILYTVKSVNYVV